MKTSLSLLHFKEDFDIIVRFDDVALVFVPEPNTLILLGLGGMALHCLDNAGNRGGLKRFSHYNYATAIALHVGFICYRFLPFVDFFCQPDDDVFVPAGVEKIRGLARVFVQIEELAFIHVAEAQFPAVR